MTLTHFVISWFDSKICLSKKGSSITILIFHGCLENKMYLLFNEGGSITIQILHGYLEKKCIWIGFA